MPARCYRDGYVTLRFASLVLACGFAAGACSVQAGSSSHGTGAGGAAGSAGAGGAAGVSGAAGATGCATSQSLCSGACVDLQNDNANCGACGVACPAGLTCANGSCCPAPTILCGNACLDPTEDDANCGACGHTCSGGEHCAAGQCRASNIQHVVLIVQENHTFDSYFGDYCQAPAGSEPSCTQGPACCERAPDVEPHGASPIVLDDNSNYSTDRDHAQACELQQIDGGKMDGFVSGSSGADTCLGVGPSCASANNWAIAGAGTVGWYWSLADQYALADRYFQPIAGGTASNNMYFAVAHFEFRNNDQMPDTLGVGCSDPTGLCLSGKRVLYTGVTTIADALMSGGKTFGVYADGFAEAKQAGAGSCASPPGYCPYSSCILHPVACDACVYDPSDDPFTYYAQLTSSPSLKDYNDLQTDLAAGTLPSFSYVKAREYRNEHPNVSKISDGVAFVKQTVDAVEASSFADSTLVLLTWDEGGGFFDHVSPPPGVDTDDAGNVVPYGTRVPLLAIGKFARKGTVSHVTMEHSSIVRFLEYNFLGPVGQLGANDAKVHNIGSLLDKTAVGIPVPE